MLTYTYINLNDTGRCKHKVIKVIVKKRCILVQATSRL